MTTQESKELHYNNEVETVERTLYTLAGYADPDEKISIDTLGDFGGYDLGELQKIAKNAKEAVKYNKRLNAVSKKMLARRIIRDKVHFLVAQAISRRGFF